MKVKGCTTHIHNNRSIYLFIYLHLYEVLRCTRAHGKGVFLKLRWQLRYKRCFLFNGFDWGGGSHKHITLTAEFCGTKKCRGWNWLKVQAGGDRRETGGASDSSVHRLTRFCVLTHPRDRWEIKRKRKQRMNSRFWSGRSSYCTFLCRGKVQ